MCVGFDNESTKEATDFYDNDFWMLTSGGGFFLSLMVFVGRLTRNEVLL